MSLCYQDFQQIMACPEFEVDKVLGAVLLTVYAQLRKFKLYPTHPIVPSF